MLYLTRMSYIPCFFSSNTSVNDVIVEANIEFDHRSNDTLKLSIYIPLVTFHVCPCHGTIFIKYYVACAIHLENFNQHFSCWAVEFLMMNIYLS